MCICIHYIYIWSKAVFFRCDMIIGHHRAGTAMTLPQCLAHSCGNNTSIAKLVDKAKVMG